MSDTALAALYRAVQTRLAGSGEAWAARASAEIASAGTVRPYVIYSFHAGGESNDHVGKDARITLVIKCVADTMAVGLAGAARISELFNDADQSRAGALSGGAYWIIKTSTQAQVVHYVEMIDGKQVHHCGHRFVFNMEGI
jgi:hypothetical protein